MHSMVVSFPIERVTWKHGIRDSTSNLIKSNMNQLELKESLLLSLFSEANWLINFNFTFFFELSYQGSLMYSKLLAPL